MAFNKARLENCFCQDGSVSGICPQGVDDNHAQRVLALAERFDLAAYGCPTVCRALMWDRAEAAAKSLRGAAFPTHYASDFCATLFAELVPQMLSYAQVM